MTLSISRLARCPGPVAALAAAALIFSVSMGRANGQAATPPVVNVVATDGASLVKAVAAHRGKVVLLNIWATWCGPCVKEFPDLVKLHETYRDRGLVIITASLDEPEDRAKVVSFLEAHRADFPAYSRKGGSVEQFMGPVDRKWPGAIPTTYLFGRDGKPVGNAIVGSRSFAQFSGLVEPLLK
jgi:thiol-disulfide isomerase/thioredoxin